MSAAHPEDLELAQQIAAGDEAAAATFFQNHGGELFGFARKMLADVNAAEDVLQEAMLGMLRSICNFDGRVSIRAWSFAILRNKIVDQIRKNGRDLLVTTSDPERENYDNSGSWKANQSIDPWDEQAELLEIVRRCMELLPHNQREALHLRAIEGMAAQDVAEVLDMTYANLRQTLHRGRQSVRRCTDQHLGGDSGYTDSGTGGETSQEGGSA
jgi:RNA polymerase sigma-70 factor, ECF subfamily